MYPYPKEILADTYVSKLGGFSHELEKQEIGINERALEMNTSLIGGVTRVRLKFFERKDKPFFMRKEFTVIPLTSYDSGVEFSKHGEVVMAEEHRDSLRDEIGRAVVINSVESFRFDGDYSSMKKAVESMRDWIWRSGSLSKRN